MNHIPSPIPKTSDEWLELDIKAAGADKAPRITLDDIEANIIHEMYIVPLTALGEGIHGYFVRGTDIEQERAIESHGLLTICVLTLRNGFTVTGESACASPENFNAEIGEKIARQNAIDKIWPLMGYELRSKLVGGAA